MTDRNVFWDDLAQDLGNPSFRKMFTKESLGRQQWYGARLRCFIGKHQWEIYRRTSHGAGIRRGISFRYCAICGR